MTSECKFCHKQVKNYFWKFTDTGRVICNRCKNKPMIDMELKEKGYSPKQIKEYMAKLDEKLTRRYREAGL